MGNERLTISGRHLETLSVWNHLQNLIHVEFPQKEIEFSTSSKQEKRSKVFHISRIASTYKLQRYKKNSMNYKTQDRDTLNSLTNRNIYLPRAINTVHSQNTCKSPFMLEGFAIRNRYCQVRSQINKYRNI